MKRLLCVLFLTRYDSETPIKMRLWVSRWASKMRVGWRSLQVNQCYMKKRWQKKRTDTYWTSTAGLVILVQRKCMLGPFNCFCFRTLWLGLHFLQYCPHFLKCTKIFMPFLDPERFGTEKTTNPDFLEFAGLSGSYKHVVQIDERLGAVKFALTSVCFSQGHHLPSNGKACFILRRARTATQHERDQRQSRAIADPVDWIDVGALAEKKFVAVIWSSDEISRAEVARLLLWWL